MTNLDITYYIISLPEELQHQIWRKYWLAQFRDVLHELLNTGGYRCRERCQRLRQLPFHHPLRILYNCHLDKHWNYWAPGERHMSKRELFWL